MLPPTVSIRVFRFGGFYPLSRYSAHLAPSRSQGPPVLLPIMRPYISTCVAGAKNSLSAVGFFGGEISVPVLLARNLPLHERIIRQLAVPVPPPVQAILIQGAGFVRPSHAAEQHGKRTIEPRDLRRIE